MSSWHTSQLTYALGLSGMFGFYGIVTVGIWLLGDKLGYDMAYRVIIIGVVLITLPFALIGGYVVSRRQKKAELAAAQEAENQAAADGGGVAAAPAKLTSPTGKYDELTTSTEEVVQFLKSSNLGAGKDAVYALPWYLVAGVPKSGKTSLVLSSELNFQNLPSQRQSEIKFIRPTRSIDWRVTSDAVFADTAGRYQTEGADQDEWAGLLDTIKKYRPARPLDGMILAVSAERILHADEAEIEQAAKVLRARIDEAIARTKTRFPIYLVFTHADAIEGFRDSFSTSQREGQNLVWGATIPLEQTANAHALFDPEYDLLQKSVQKRRLIRLSAPFAPVRQLKIFNFPLHFGSARRKLGAFVSTLFRPNPFSESPFLRGFYFTAVPVNRQSGRGGAQAQAAQTVGQSFFTERLFREVILRDKDLVATLQAQKVKPPIMGWVLTLMGAFLTVLLLAFAGYSLYQNKKMLDTASKRGDAVLTITKADQGKNPLDKKPEDARSEIDAMENLRLTLVDLDNNERNGAPYSMRFGLYSGDRIFRDKLLTIYFNAVEHRFKVPTIKRLEADLKKFAASNAVSNSAQLTKQEEDNLSKNYDLLKAYLMLSGEHRDKAESSFLSNTLADYWKTESKVPSGYELTSLEQLKFYTKQVDRQQFPPIQPDKALVDGVRKKLQAFPAVFRYYKRVTTDISKKVDPISTENLLAGRSGGVLEGTYSVPGAYTVEGYRKHMKDAIAKAGEELGKDDWVMGENAEKAQAQGADIQRLQEKYFNDYTDNWVKFIRGINVKPYKTKEDAVNGLKAFSSAESPMAILIKEIKTQTNLSAKPKDDSWWGWIWSFLPSSETAEIGGETAVDRAFQPLVPFVGNEEAGKTTDPPIAKYTNSFKRLGDNLATKSPEQIKKISEELAGDSERDSIGLGNTKKQVNALLEGFTDETVSGPDLANLLRKPIENLEAFLGANVLEQIKKMWADNILPKAREAERGYPFEDSGEADLKKLTDYLAPEKGALSKFYKERLDRYFEDVNGQLKVRESAAATGANFDPAFVAYLNNAFKLQRALFGKSETPAFEYQFQLQKVDGALIEVTIDGQKLDSNGAGSAAFKFPASSGENGVVINLASMSDSGSTGATAFPQANSSPTPVTPSGNANSTPQSQPSNSNNSRTPGSAAPLKFPGTWGLFRFFENGGGMSKKQPGGEYLLTYKHDGKTINASVKPTGDDLFDRNLFTQARAPQSFLR